MSLQPSDRAWVVLAVGVLTYDVLAPPGQTMSEAADRWMVRHPWLVRGIALALAGHICNLVDERYDGIHWLFVLSRKWRR